MSVQLTPSKRSYDRSRKGRNGKGKLQKSSIFNSQHNISPGDTIFRVLCPISNIGSVIGKNGSIISKIRKETGAKVRVEEPLPGSDERVIFISSSEKESEIVAEGTKEVIAEEMEDTDEITAKEEVAAEEMKEDTVEVTAKKEVAAEEMEEEATDEVTIKEEVAAEELKQEDTDEVTAKEEGDKASDVDKGDAIGEDDNEDQKSVSAKVLQPEKKKSSAQKALLLVFEKIVLGESEKTGGGEESGKSASMIVRLLVFTSQMGCILGKAGSTIKQMSNESGAQIQVLPKDNVPPFASPRNEIVQISGRVDVVRNALEAVSQQLLENPPLDQDIISSKPSGPVFHSFGNHHAKSGAYQEKGIPGPMNPSGDILTFRMLCDDKRMGGVIGRGGAIIKALQYETGCEIKIVERIPGLDDRIIVISGQVHPDERISAPQDAVLRVQDRIFRAIPETQESTVPAKLLINSNQIGCLLGKGGSVIAEMRKSTGAHIRILGKDQLPNCASEDEEVVQINGEFDAVQDALMHITTRLRDHFFRHAFPTNVGPPFLPNVGPPFQRLPPHEGFHPHDDPLPFVHRAGVPRHISEREPYSAWGPQDYTGVPQRKIGGFGGVFHHPIITNISVEVVVPRSCVDAIYGEDGGCLKQIREFSEAKISITDPKPGATETLITISGTPEQTHAAQSLIQAFVMIEQEAL